jgi:hypothetical protein
VELFLDRLGDQVGVELADRIRRRQRELELEGAAELPDAPARYDRRYTSAILAAYQVLSADQMLSTDQAPSDAPGSATTSARSSPSPTAPPAQPAGGQRLRPGMVGALPARTGGGRAGEMAALVVVEEGGVGGGAGWVFWPGAAVEPAFR